MSNSKELPQSGIQFSLTQRHQALDYRPCDLAGGNSDLRTHLIRTHQINIAATERAHPDRLNAFLNGDKSAYSEHEAAIAEKLISDNRAFAESVETPLARHIRSGIQRRYDLVDWNTKNASKEELAAARLAEMPEGILVLSDFDNTITDEEKAPKIQGTNIKAGLPGAVPSDVVLAEHMGRLGFSDASTLLFPAVFQKVIEEYPEALFENGRTAPLREGVDEFFNFLNNSNTPFRIVSANMSPTIWGALSKFECPTDTEVYAYTPDSTRSSVKDAVIATEAIENPDRAVIYIGDGGSDIPALKANDVVSIYFGLEGSAFAKELEETGVLYFTYNSLEDIVKKLKEIEDINRKKQVEKSNFTSKDYSIYEKELKRVLGRRPVFKTA